MGNPFHSTFVAKSFAGVSKQALQAQFLSVSTAKKKKNVFGQL